MTIVSWNNKVNTKILRNGSSWSEITGFIADETRSGKVKRRLAHSHEKRPFSVSMLFTTEEYEEFHLWYLNDLRYGLYAFYFPRIDSKNKDVMRAYRFTKDGAPQYSNESGNKIKVTMKWEEV